MGSSVACLYLLPICGLVFKTEWRTFLIGRHFQNGLITPVLGNMFTKRKSLNSGTILLSVPMWYQTSFITCGARSALRVPSSVYGKSLSMSDWPAGRGHAFERRIPLKRDARLTSGLLHYMSPSLLLRLPPK